MMAAIVWIESAAIVALAVLAICLHRRIVVLKQALSAPSGSAKSEPAADEPKDRQPVADAPSPLADGDEDERKLFEQIHRTIVEQHLFLDPQFSREKYIRLGLINKNETGKLLRRYAGTNLTGYINDLRLEYAIGLMAASPGLPMKAVSANAGFNSLRSFFRVFSQKYGMTPAEYKKKVIPLHPSAGAEAQRQKTER